MTRPSALRPSVVLAILAAVWAAGPGLAATAPPQPRPEATSFTGRPLFPPPLSEAARARMEDDRARAEAAWAANRADADAHIWLGRRTAYLGRYRDAIAIFTDGIARHPSDARFYRHRGHRHLTVREIDRAIADLEKAAEMIRGRPDQVEPDGQPNARGIPTSTLHSNIWYHLALGYYLKGNYTAAASAWQSAREAVNNPDNLVAASHWLYISLRRAGRADEAAAVLTRIHADLDVIENGSYHALLLLYKGERTAEAVLAAAGEGAGATAVRYGVGAWHLVNGRRAEAAAIWRAILQGADWPAFGHLAAENELK